MYKRFKIKRFSFKIPTMTLAKREFRSAYYFKTQKITPYVCVVSLVVVAGAVD